MNFTQEFIAEEIERVLALLQEQNSMIFDYWLSELYVNEWKKNQERWNENTVLELYDDLSINA